MTSSLTLAIVKTVIATVYKGVVPANDCAGFTNQLGVHAVKGWKPAVTGPTAYNVGAKSHFAGDYTHAKSAPAGAIHWFKQRTNKPILGLKPPEPGHTMPDLLGGGTNCIGVSSFTFGTRVVADVPNVQNGSVGAYLRANPQVEYWGWTADYAGASFITVVPKLAADQRVVVAEGAAIRVTPTKNGVERGIAPAGQILTADHWVTGDTIDKIDQWLYCEGNATQAAGYYWLGYFTEPNVTGIKAGTYTPPAAPAPVATKPVTPVPAPVETVPVPVATTPTPAPAIPTEPVAVPPVAVEPAPVVVTTPTAVLAAPTPVSRPVGTPPKTTVANEVNKWLSGGVVAGLIVAAGAVLAFCFGH